MDEWLAPALGFSVVAALIATVLLLPDSWLGFELRRAYQVQTSGVLGRFAPRDFLRSAAMSCSIAALLTVSSYVAMTVSFRKPGTIGLLLEAFGFAFFLLAGTTLLATVQTLVRAFRVHRTERRVAQQITIQPDLFAALGVETADVAAGLLIAVAPVHSRDDRTVNDQRSAGVAIAFRRIGVPHPFDTEAPRLRAAIADGRSVLHYRRREAKTIAAIATLSR